MIITSHHIEPYAKLIQAVMETELDINIRINNRLNQVEILNNSEAFRWKSARLKLYDDNTDFINNIIKTLEPY